MKLSKNDVLLFDMVQKAASGDRVAGEKASVAIQAFFNQPKTAVRKKIKTLENAKIQAVGVSSDFQQLTSDAFNVTIQETNFDLGYQKAFRTVTLEKGRDFWEIYDVQNGLTFRKIEEGGRIEVEGLSGDKEIVYVDYYGGAIGWSDKMIRFRKIPAMVQLAEIFRNRFWSNKANAHYLLLATAAAGNVTAYQGVAADGELRRDIQTINQASYVLTNRCKDKGYGDVATAKLLMYANPRDKSRVNAALRATTNTTLGAGNGTVGQEVDWNIDVIYTYNSNITARSPILVIPGQKIQRADAMAPKTFKSPKDPLTLNELQAVWAIYGATVGDTDQCQQITLG